MRYTDEFKIDSYPRNLRQENLTEEEKKLLEIWDRESRW